MDNHTFDLLSRIAGALERMSPPPLRATDLSAAHGFVWHADGRLEPVEHIRHINLNLLQGLDLQRDLLLENTRQFASGKPANNALLWGARGMGKSSLVKSVQAALIAEMPNPPALVEINREDIGTLPRLLTLLAASTRRFILFCDDLSFSAEESSYKSLKSVLEGGLQGRPDNVIFYATSNRRHLLPRDMIENERSTAINPHEAVEEKVSLSDRFGLWLGFHACDQPTYLAMIDGYAKFFGLKTPMAELHARALEWATTRGGRSGRVAWQFMQDAAGKAS